MVKRRSGIGLLLAALLVAPSMAYAQKVVVLPVSYELVWTGEQAEVPAGRIQLSVQRVARFVGFTVLDHQIAAEPCGEKVCLELLGESAGADEVIQIAVTDNDGVDFTVDLRFAHHEPLSLQSSSSFDSVLAWIEDQVAIALQRRRDQLGGPAGGVADETEAVSPGEPFVASAGDGLRPTAFWIALGSGTALLAAGLSLDLVVWRRSESLEDQAPDQRDPAYWETTNRLQIAEIVLLSAAGAGLITAGVMALLTDFSGGEPPAPKGEKISVKSLAPWIAHSGAGLSWSARF